MKIIVDKIASVTKNAKLKHELEITEKFTPEEGLIIAAEVLTNKRIYNKLELSSGRFSKIRKGDVIVGALGNRKALKGFVGHVPEKLKSGDVIHLLNLGGVCGVCTSENLNELGHAMKIRVLGAVINGSKKPLNIYQFRLFNPENKLKIKIPLIIVTGTCMNVGKTSAACEIIRCLTRKGIKVHGAKLAGIAALKDTKNMKDYGAKKTITITDAGHTSSIGGDNPVKVSKGALNYLGKYKPEYIVIEFGDGIYGEYGVLDILADKEIRKNIIAHIGCANDPLGALKLYEVSKKAGMPLSVISGPVTDNSVGVQFIYKKIKLPAFNAFTHGKQLFEYLEKNCF